MSDTGFNLPVIDISCIGLDKEDPLDYSSKDVTSTAKQLCDAFKNVGFVYIKNHDELVCIQKAYNTFISRIALQKMGEWSCKAHSLFDISLTLVTRPSFPKEFKMVKKAS